MGGSPRGSGQVSSINHQPWYHELTLFVKCYYSTSIWQIAIFVRKILQGEENKGVELTGGQRKCWRAGGRRREVNSRQSRQGRDLRLKVEGKSRTFLQAIQFFWRARAASRPS